MNFNKTVNPEAALFDGVEITRGTALIATVVSFAGLVINAYTFVWKNIKKAEPVNFNLGSIFIAGVVFVFTLFTASIYTSFVNGSALLKMQSSLSLFWAVFVFSMIHLAALGYVWVKNERTKALGQVDISETDENQDRGNWDSHTEYLLSMIGYAVGLGNVWRFPYLCYEYGGGGFLIPYVIMLVILGLPVFFMECAIGQFDSRGPIESWNISPAFRGIGWMMVLYSGFVGIYYNVIIAYSIFYFFTSVDSKTYWDSCDNYWNTDNCVTVGVTKTDEQMTSTEEYFNYHILKKFYVNETSNANALIDLSTQDSHDMVWQIVIVLLVAWTVVFFALIKGIKSSGKVVWFTAIFPYVVILILVIRGCTLPGAKKGIDYYMGKESDLSKLGTGEIWRVAASQIFFSLSAGWGGVQALSSYNNFNNNCYRDAIIVACTNCLTSIFAGFAIFSVLGNMADSLGVEVPEVVKSSFGLAFTVYPAALSKLPGANFWACLFFLMLFTLGLDSQFTILETVATSLCDWSPKLKKRRISTMAGVSIILFLIALLCCTKAGIDWVNLIDTYVSGWAILMSTVFEVIVLGTVYGGGVWAWITGKEQRLCDDVEMMIGKRSNLWWFFWKLHWYFISPVVMLALLIWGWVEYSDPALPAWGRAVGWIIVCAGLIGIPYYIILEAWRAKKCGKSFWSIFQPNEKWGPYLKEYQTGRYANIRKD